MMTISYDPTAAPGGDAGAKLETEHGARAQIKEVKDQVVDQARTSFRQARDSATTSINESRHQAADRIGGLAGAVRSTSEHLRAENQSGIANLTDSLADQVERLSGYLRDRDLGAVRDDVEAFARRQPAVAVGVALALGMLGARFLKSSRQTGEPDRGSRFQGEGYGSGQFGGYGTSSQPAGGGYGGA